MDIVIALIYRTVYPFNENIAEHALERMNYLFTKAGINNNDSRIRVHYEELGWFLSICDRIASYSLGNFEHSQELASVNDHAMGLHPSVINERTVRYFTDLKTEKSMLNRVLQAIPENVRKNFYDNVAGFRRLWEYEVEIRAKLHRKEMNLITKTEITGNDFNDNLIMSIMGIRKEVHAPVPLNEKDFEKSFYSSMTILVTLRTNEHDETIVGYVKGGPLEKYRLRKGTFDENFGRENTIYMEWIRIKPEYWGENGGHILRTGFVKEARNRGYEFLSGYIHRDVIRSRINKGEAIELVQKYDPDKLDYYRIEL